MLKSFAERNVRLSLDRDRHNVQRETETSEAKDERLRNERTGQRNLRSNRLTNWDKKRFILELLLLSYYGVPKQLYGVTEIGHVT